MDMIETCRVQPQTNKLLSSTYFSHLPTAIMESCLALYANSLHLFDPLPILNPSADLESPINVT